MPDGELKEKIEQLAASVKFPLTKLYVIDGSRRSSHSNAYFYGFFKNKRIVLFDTLLDQMDDHNQILAVLAHEIGHWFHSHTLKLLVVSQIHLLLLFVLFSHFIRSVALFESFGFQQTTSNGYMPILIAFLLFSYVYSPVESILSFFMKMLTRYNEFQADQYAKDKGYGVALCRALLKLSVENKGMLWPDPWYVTYHYSHPPVVQRIDDLGGIQQVLDEEERIKKQQKVKNDEQKENVEEQQEEDFSDLRAKKEKYLFENVLRKRV